MATYGHINEFNPKLETFQAWNARFRNYLQANDVKEEKYKNIFLATVGPQTYGILLDVLQPQNPEMQTFEELVNTLQSYFQPKKIITAERHKFRTEVQKPGESINEFATKLKRLASTCKFGPFLQDALRDQLIYGIRNATIQKKLIEGNFEYEKSLETAIMLEQIERDSKPFVHEHHSKPTEYADTYRLTCPNKYTRERESSAKSQAPKATTAKPKRYHPPCTRCLGRNHDPQDCYYKTYQCRKCNKIGHLAKACKFRPFKAPNTMEIEYKENGQDIACVTPNASSNVTSKERKKERYTPNAELWELQDERIRNPYKVTINICDQPVEMVIDCGAAVSVISEAQYNEVFSNIPIDKTDLKLQVYGGKSLKTLGQIPVKVEYKNRQYDLRLVVTKGTAETNPPLLGREWLDKIPLNWTEIFAPRRQLNAVETKEGAAGQVPEFLQKYAQLNSPSFGEIKNFTVSLVLKENYSPIFCKARPVPLALKEKVSTELDKLVEQKIIFPVRHSEWATPLVIVPKANGEIRICGDFRATVNRQIETEHYPLPSIEDIFNTVNNGKIFTVLDLSQAYLQLKVSEESQPLLTINTHKGLYRYTRLPYGISAAPMLFQATMDQLLQGIPNTMCYLDDILVAGSSKEDCQTKVETVLRRLEEHNVRIRSDKCVWLSDRVQYLGHQIDEHGIHPLQSKVSAITQTPTPRNIDDLRVYLGLLNYYRKFIPNLSTKLHPLYRLLQKDVKWDWSQECNESFQSSKELLTSDSVLVPYNPEQPLRLACDASKIGIGVVLSHIMEDGSERPIQFASKTLTTTEQNYSNIEREALAIVYGIKKFHKYLFGRRFQLISDHKPLQAIFGSQRHTSQTISMRLQRWSIALSAYQFDFIYKRGNEHANADALSRLPTSEELEAVENPVFYFSPVSNIPLTATDVQKETSKDPILQQVKEFVQNGWPTHLTAQQLQPYWIRKFELSVEDGCLLWGSRVVIPKTLQAEVLKMLHEGHQGTSRTKSIARTYYWWPHMDEHIENAVRACDICQQTRPCLPPTSLRPWPIPQAKWERIHVDLSVLAGHNVFLVVDAYSKWIDVEVLEHADTVQILEKLRSLFAAYGLPNTVVTDNGPQFISTEFEEFMQNNGIQHLFSPPYHPSSNGQVERMVQTLKNDIKRQVLEDESSNDGRSLQHKIANFLFVYRTTPHSLTKTTPAEAFLGRPLKTRFDLLKPSYTARIEKATLREKIRSDTKRRRETSFGPGSQVWIYQSWLRRKKATWVKGHIREVISPTIFLVDINGTIRRVHADCLRSAY